MMPNLLSLVELKVITMTSSSSNTDGIVGIMKTIDSCHDAKFVVTGGTKSYHNDNL